MDIQKVLRRRIILFNLTEKSLTALARMGGIFITVGDLFACGKEHTIQTPPGVTVLVLVLINSLLF